MDITVAARFIELFVEPRRGERWAEQLRGKRSKKQLDHMGKTSARK